VDAALTDANRRLLSVQAINALRISKEVEFCLMMQKMGVVRTFGVNRSKESKESQDRRMSLFRSDDSDEAVKQN
jgi:hypothetical protein